jgi:hypothetical protein
MIITRVLKVAQRQRRHGRLRPLLCHAALSNSLYQKVAIRGWYFWLVEQDDFKLTNKKK